MSSNLMFSSKAKFGSKLSTRIDADGKEVEVEVREDEDQKLKLQEIIDLLVAAGYFRARIKGLSAFDKIVGGMTWCIGTCNFDVDVDLLFQENLTIGQRIALTEKIVRVLPKMKCPHNIEPHQIQGLDFIHVFPVVQWLVKRVLETRDETGGFTRSFAMSQFQKTYSGIGPNHCAVLRSVMAVKEAYHPQRQFRRIRKSEDVEEAEALQVESTLLEYGYLGMPVVPSSVETKGSSGEEGEIVLKGAAAGASPAEIQRADESRVAAGIVGSIVSTHAEEIAHAAEEYAKMQMKEGSLENSMNNVSLQSQRALSTLESLQEELASMEQEVEKLKEEREQEMVKGEEIQRQLKDVRKRREMGNEELKRLEGALAQLDGGGDGLLKKLRSLVLLNETLKEQEKSFKEQCRSELTGLQKLVKDATEAATACDKEGENKGGDAGPEHQIEEERTRLAKARLVLAKHTRAVASLKRHVDDVPGRAELAQYQRRFLELYNQVASKHRETKQFYTLYNTLDDTKLYLSKELNLLNSILDTYGEAMSSAAGKEQFMRQFDLIVEGVKQNKMKVGKRRTEEIERREALAARLLTLVEAQRKYVAAVSQLTAECRRNEALLAQVRGSSGP
ncbi:coiled-coil domain-containing protein 93 isoform X2 [Ischnura elegans]|uniref:coiled-coil domain-containing protein 93 isoform X2 n=1 Tax=Ischnura elegans TaxID=197161 RepID=UPI001ED8B4D1|nr:coiled-coil domain-containing protein 93 isoform X2 [Ischnura elegans]